MSVTPHEPDLSSYPYAKHAEVTVPSLADWEKDWEKNSQRSVQPKLLPVDFRSPSGAGANQIKFPIHQEAEQSSEAEAALFF